MIKLRITLLVALSLSSGRIVYYVLRIVIFVIFKYLINTPITVLFDKLLFFLYMFS